jgi:hypothetical protein
MNDIHDIEYLDIEHFLKNCSERKSKEDWKLSEKQCRNLQYKLYFNSIEMFFWCGFCEAQFNRMITWVAFNQQ